MSALRRSCLVLCLAAALAPAADPTLMNLVMPNARAISGMNISQALNSPLGQFLLSQVSTSDADLQQFIAATGFDPRHDLHEVLIAAPAGPNDGRGLIMVRGLFDTPKILAHAKQQGVITLKYKGVEVFTGSGKDQKWFMNSGKDKREGWFTFLDNSIALMGDAASVRGAIDRRSGGQGPDARLVARAHQLSNRYDIWGVSMIPVSEFANNLPDENVKGAMKGDVIRSIQETSGGVKFGSDVEIAGEAVTRSEKDATALADVVRFFIGLIQLNQKDAKIAGPAKVLQGMELKAEGNIIRLALRIPEADLEKLILSAKAQAQQVAAQAAAQAARGTQPAVRRQPKPRANPGEIVVHSSPKDMGTVRIKPEQ